MLRYIFFGATSRLREGYSGENYFLIIDGHGSIIKLPFTSEAARQDKICRWNLSIRDQRRYGFDRQPPASVALPPVIKEGITEAQSVYIFDISGFGRLVCLICASLEHNQPADWLVQNARPDWVYAPVMDSSTGLGETNSSPLEKWTVRRAVRAACLSRGRVIVANSMALQEYENIENENPAHPDGSSKLEPRRSRNDSPGVALMIDGRSEELLHRVSEANIPAKADDRSPIILVEKWGEAWEVLPTIVA
ncbi:MAG: hypothetical protein K2Q27_11255 [Novosphingobium sp.]|nr:hypothetical protein [Novosphingobium sp.]